MFDPVNSRVRGPLEILLDTAMEDMGIPEEEECGIPSSSDYKDLKESWTLGDSFWSGSNVARANAIGQDLVPPFTWVSSSGASFSHIDLVMHTSSFTRTTVDTQAVFTSDHRLLQRQKRHLMSSMLDSSGRTVEDNEGVKKVEYNFYKDLYNTKATDDTLIVWILSQLESDSEQDEREEEKDPELMLEELTLWQEP
ncbi:UNVERIFIED_CONTAM: hypothetical protein FKN15_041551 [Acipenser sinensis]